MTFRTENFLLTSCFSLLTESNDRDRLKQRRMYRVVDYGVGCSSRMLGRFAATPEVLNGLAGCSKDSSDNVEVPI